MALLISDTVANWSMVAIDTKGVEHLRAALSISIIAEDSFNIIIRNTKII